MELSSRRITDDDGLPLRTSHFPFNLEYKSPPKSAGYGLRPVRPPEKKIMSKSVRGMIPQLPTTFMMVDFQQDRKAITAKLLMETMKRDQSVPSSLSAGVPGKRSPRRHRSPDRPPQPLRSSFVLQTQPNIIKAIDVATAHVPQPSNSNEQSIQTEIELDRQELNISAYQIWSSKTVEPFFKDLRKAVKAHRPAQLEEYIIAFCLARIQNQSAPETKTSSTSPMKPTSNHSTNKGTEEPAPVSSNKNTDDSASVDLENNSQSGDI